MKSILANFSASISELKRNPTALLKEADGAPIAILNHNTPSAYLVPAATYELLMDSLEDQELGQLIREREAERAHVIKVSLDEL
jgi:antitoxin StbD